MFWESLIIQELRINLTLQTFFGNQTIPELRTLQTFGGNLITQSLRMVVIMALLRLQKLPERCSAEHLHSGPHCVIGVMALWGSLGERMKITLKTLQ